MFPCITATVTCFDTGEFTWVRIISIQYLQSWNLLIFDVVVDLHVDADTIAAFETKRKELLPNLSEVTFVELSIQNKSDDGDCNGKLPPNIYKQVDECLNKAED